MHRSRPTPLVLLPLVLAACGGGGSVPAPVASPSIVCTPDAIDFGVVTGGATPSRTLTCTNEGTAQAQLSFEPPAGPGAASFALVGAADHALAPGERASVDVVASGMQPGVHEAALPVTLAGTGRIGNVPLRMERIAAALELRTPTDAEGCVQVGIVAPGSARDTAIELANVSGDAVAISSVRVEGEGAPLLTLLDPAPGAMQPGSAATVRVRFAPMEAGRSRAQLVVTSSDPVLPQREICLVGDAGGPRLACDVEALTFPLTASGGPRTLPVTCTNDGWPLQDPGADRLVVDSIATHAPVFLATVRGGLVETGYAIGERFVIDVTFAPVADGAETGRLEIASNDAVGSPLAIPLAGAGRDLPACDFEVLPPSVRFGAFDMEAATLAFEVVNRLDEGCLLENFRVEGEGAAHFALDAEEGVVVLAGGGRRVVPVTFTRPAGASVETAVVRFAASGFADEVEVPLRAVADAGCLAAGAVDFGAVAPSCAQASRTVAIENRCDRPVAVLGVEPQQGSFDVPSLPATPATLQPGERLQLEVQFADERTGEHYGQVFVSADDDGGGFASEEPLGIPLHATVDPAAGCGVVP